MGTNIAFLFVNYNDQLSKFNLIIFLIISLLIGVNFDKIFSMNTSSTTSSVFTIFMNLLGAFLLIVFTLSNVNIQNFLSNKYLKYLGKISFSMYLIHPLVLGTISSFLFVKLNNYLSQNTLFFVIFMTSLIFSIVAADIIYRLIDKPSIFIADSIYKIINEKILKRIIHD
jgi:peptidoglycan/LPS O-acetylase OafA/YrhL